MKLEGRFSFLGRKAILKQKPWESPTSFAQRRQMSPRIACKNKWARIEAIQRATTFVEAYREALKRFMAGEKDVEFPLGTYWMVRYVGACCVPALRSISS